MRLLVDRLAEIKLASLTIVIGEALGPDSAFISGFVCFASTISILLERRWIFAQRTDSVKRA